MKHDQVLRIGSLPSKKKVIDAAKHNLREIPSEDHIDQARSHLNRVLHGATTAKEVERQARSAWNGIEKIRKNAMHGVEVLVCLPFSFDGDAMAFFTDALAWADEFFQVPVLSAVAHFDEPAPHMHVVLLPVVDGELQGSKVMGNLKRIQAMQTDFYASVGARYGLRRKATARRSKDDRRKAASQILDAIIANPALLSGGQVKNLLLDLIAQNPEPFAAPVGMAMPELAQKKSMQTFVGIMTKPQKPERKQSPIGNRQSPIGVSDLKTEMSYALVGDLISASEKAPVIDAPTIMQTEPATVPMQEPAHRPEKECDVAPLSTSATSTMPDADLVPVDDGDFERVRDEEPDPGEWDADRGEFVRQTSRPSRKAQADHVVHMALASKQSPSRGRWRIASP